VVRRASLIFSVTLLVAMAAGYFARRNEVTHARDVELAAAADVASARMSAIVDAIEIAAATGTDPDTTAAALVDTNPRLSVCAVIREPASCAGQLPEPPADLVGAHARYGELSAVDEPGPAVVAAYDSMITIEIDGPALSIVVRAPVDVIDQEPDLAVWATTFLPERAVGEGFTVADGVRQTSLAVDAAPGVYVVAATEDAVNLPVGEQRFYVVIFVLAFTLMLLSGATLLMEHRNLLERATFDPLTKLPNRSEFERRAGELLANAQRNDTGVCLMLFDLNGFKLVNDTHGHLAGDELLRIVGARLRKAVRDYDVVARWGGDEFVVVMPGIGDETMGSKRAAQLAEQVSGRARLDTVPESLRIKVSVGVALYPQHGADLTSLMDAADTAMYSAKRGGTTLEVASDGYHGVDRRVAVG
jgi:diguanylate cyclase (GGDEF)-like protein